ncbi:Hypothetical predicted protein [Marmota monax]|uniref:Low-density lipoprotein receptor class A domain-containing protein 3 n=1 Tax=Marmota monax TaxID=9995 RepID=A0A5E4AXS0_MARMO|nr:Hypothetical predicted protein [Marmota monax]
MLRGRVGGVQNTIAAAQSSGTVLVKSHLCCPANQLSVLAVPKEDLHSQNWEQACPQPQLGNRQTDLVLLPLNATQGNLADIPKQEFSTQEVRLQAGAILQEFLLSKVSLCDHAPHPPRPQAWRHEPQEALQLQERWEGHTNVITASCLPKRARLETVGQHSAVVTTFAHWGCLWIIAAAGSGCGLLHRQGSPTSGEGCCGVLCLPGPSYGGQVCPTRWEASYLCILSVERSEPLLKSLILVDIFQTPEAQRVPVPLLQPCAEPGSGQVFVTSENQLVYYPSITYAIIGSSVIFVLVVALLALVLHHQRKRNNLMTLPVHRLQHPVLLSRLVVLDHPHHCNVTYNVNNGIQYVASQAEQNASEVGSPPSYSEALLDQRPAWYDLPPPPYSSDTESLNQGDLPPYRSRSGSADSASSQAASSLLSVEDTTSHSPGQPGPAEGTAQPRDSVPSEGTEQV